MATAQQVADRIQRQQLESIDEGLSEINKMLRKYDALIEQRNRLTAARRALLSERASTPGGGRGLTQEEVVKALGGLGVATVDMIAEKLSATPGSVRGHLNRGKNELFSAERRADGIVFWQVRDPETEEQEEDDDDE